MKKSNTAKCTTNSQAATVAAVVIVASPDCSVDRNKYKTSIPSYHATGVVAPPVIHPNQYCCPAAHKLHNIKHQFWQGIASIK